LHVWYPGSPCRRRRYWKLAMSLSSAAVVVIAGLLPEFVT
jgi:hypothetical protein